VVLERRGAIHSGAKRSARRVGRTGLECAAWASVLSYEAEWTQNGGSMPAITS
jgi:hypothetical protein